jgi:hypothetical protein
MPATNTLLNTNMLLAKSLVILHQKINIVGSVNRTYDDSFAQSGAKIGTSVRIRLPVQYTVSSGPTLAVQNSVETNTTLTVNTQNHVDFSFSSTELTMNIDQFAARYLEPAMCVLAASLESQFVNIVYPQIYNQVGVTGAQTFKNFLAGRKALLDNLAPQSKQWMARINTQDNVDMVDQLKGLFQQSTAIASQYTDGVMGYTAGFEFAENTFLNTYTRGAENGAYTLNGVPATGATTAVVAAGAGAGNAGDIFTIANVFRVHPETKINTGVLQQFVLTAAYAGGAGTISFSPAMNYSATGQQNINAAPGTSAAITFLDTASTARGQSLVYHPDFATFATADLVQPGGVDMSSRQTKDGISMRLVRQYDINNDVFPARLDVLWGAAVLRPQLACRVAAN